MNAWPAAIAEAYWYLANQDWVNGIMSEKYAEWISLNYAKR